MVYRVKKSETVAPLFKGWEETLIYSCLQGVMGKVYADSIEMPSSAMVILGDFCFFAGKPNKELILYTPEFSKKDFMIFVPQDEQWAKMIQNCHGKNVRRVIRYATKKETVFDIDHLSRVVEGLPEKYTLQMMDEQLFMKCKEIEWCRDWVSQYFDYEMYKKYGMGAIILENNEPISGASSYSGYHGGIEIEIDTKEEYRRKGLAYISGAKLILECLKRGWYPSWDAQNRRSLSLAEKLGYEFAYEYLAYEIWYDC